MSASFTLSNTDLPPQTLPENTEKLDKDRED